MKITKSRFKEMIKDMEFLGSYKHVGTWDSQDGYFEWRNPVFIKNHVYNVYGCVYYELDECIEDSCFVEKFFEKKKYIFYDITSGTSVILELLETNEGGDPSIYFTQDGNSIIRDYVGRQSCESTILEEFIIDPNYVRKMKLAQLNQIANSNENETNTAL